MIISHTHKYVFVELPHTGSTAIGRELCDLYQGQPFLYKHATYEEFLRHATALEKHYFVFSCIRNPMDDAVTYYYKYKNDHNDSMSILEKRPWFTKWVYTYRRNRYHFVQETNVSFQQFFLKYYRWPYDNWSSLSHHKFDYIIRFEKLGEDFSQVLRLLNVEQIRPLPQIHQTEGKNKTFVFHYAPETRERVVTVFGPFMKKWGYEFPDNWLIDTVPWRSYLFYRLLNIPRQIFWRYIRPAIYARITEERGDDVILPSS